MGEKTMLIVIYAFFISFQLVSHHNHTYGADISLQLLWEGA